MRTRSILSPLNLRESHIFHAATIILILANFWVKSRKPYIQRSEKAQITTLRNWFRILELLEKGKKHQRLEIKKLNAKEAKILKFYLKLSKNKKKAQNSLTLEAPTWLNHLKEVQSRLVSCRTCICRKLTTTSQGFQTRAAKSRRFWTSLNQKSGFQF